MHTVKDVSISEIDDGEDEVGTADPEGNRLDSSQAIDFLTGRHYGRGNQQNTQAGKRDIQCPWPNAFGLHPDLSKRFSSHSPVAAEAMTQPPCAYMFSRAYDLARHLHAEHAMHELDMDDLVAWVAEAKKKKNRVA